MASIIAPSDYSWLKVILNFELFKFDSQLGSEVKWREVILEITAKNSPSTFLNLWFPNKFLLYIFASSKLFPFHQIFVNFQFLSFFQKHNDKTYHCSCTPPLQSSYISLYLGCAAVSLSIPTIDQLSISIDEYVTALFYGEQRSTSRAPTLTRKLQ